MKRSRRGFATYMAILLLLLVATTLAALGMMFTADARRTRSIATEAQLRQLLTAGAVVAMKQLDHPQATTKPFEIPLPADLAGDGAKLSVVLAPADADPIAATIRAQQGKRMMQQFVRFERRDEKWQPIVAGLGDGEVSAEPPAPSKDGSAGASPSR